MTSSLLVVFFANPDDAPQACRALGKKGFLRTAWVHRQARGIVQRFDPFHQRQAWMVLASLLIAGSVAALIAALFMPVAASSDFSRSVGLPTLMGALLGALFGAVFYRRSRYGVSLNQIHTCTHTLMTGETALLVEGPSHSLRLPRTMLMEWGEIPPVVFLLHDGKERSIAEERSGGTLSTTVQQQELAVRIAKEHVISGAGTRNLALIKGIEHSRRWVQAVCRELAEVNRLDQRISPTGEWLLDNEYILESNARDVQLNLPWAYYRQLPALEGPSFGGLPRIYALASEFSKSIDLRISPENILAFLQYYQSVAVLTIGELWAVPQMLRTVLIQSIEVLASRTLKELCEHEQADFWASRLITANRRDPNHLFTLMAELTASQPHPTQYFAAQLVDGLYDEAAALAPVQAWIERIFEQSIQDLVTREKRRQTRDQLSMGNAFTSLRQLELIDWKVCFEQLSRVEQILREDPAGIYPRMDFATRDRYRRAIEDVHRGSGLSEDHVAQQVIKAALDGAAIEKHPCAAHVGTYLIGPQRANLIRRLKGSETFRYRALHWAYRRHTMVYLSGLGVATSGLIMLILTTGLSCETLLVQALFILLLLLPVSQLALEILNYVVMRLCPPRPPPKLDFLRSGIPDACRTLVVIPMMLNSEVAIHAEAEKLELRYLANQEANLLFALYSDYIDAAEPNCIDDEVLLTTARSSIEQLNIRYGGSRFLLLHRERKWCETEQKYIGWERKRGKLEELNALIVAPDTPGAHSIVHVGEIEQLASIRYIITLDSDTQLPHDSARRLIETLAHPLNQARFDDAGKVVAGTFTIIQPRVSASLPSSSRTPFSRLFSDPIGIDPYTQAVSDVYQDLAGEGSYHGKGIYDVRAFSRVLAGCFPEGRILSHDLIEGAHVRVGLASDIELFDEFPKDCASYLKRQHRWIRGDWQIARWLLPTVPLADGRRVANPLAWFDRWKIFDNLRRSLLPVGSLALLLAAWLISPRLGWIATAVVATQLFFHALAQPLTWATTAQPIKAISIARLAHELLRMLVEAALLPVHTCLNLDAILRACYRMLVSRRGLLEWTSAQALHETSRARFQVYLLRMGVVSLFSLMVGMAVLHWHPASLVVAGPWLVLWLLSLPIGWVLNRHPLTTQPRFLLTPADRVFLRKISRRTWRYFRDFVTEATAWLPPDNYQIGNKQQLAMRTSPTNIGLYLVSGIGAHALGYLTVDGVARMLSRSMKAIGQLERHEGHLLNWYDLQTLAPLNPRYVSAVDSGNLLGSLWTLGQGIEVLLHEPLLGVQTFAGLRDTAACLQDEIVATAKPGVLRGRLQGILDRLDAPSLCPIDTMNLLREIDIQVQALTTETGAQASSDDQLAYWLGQLSAQLNAWLENNDRYFSWIEVLSENPAEALKGLESRIPTAVQSALKSIPSISQLASGDLEIISVLRESRGTLPHDARNLPAWADRVLVAFDRAQWLAGETMGQLNESLQDCRLLSTSINMCFLYNPERRLFSIGFNVSEGRLDRAFYDLLASEARLGSFVAIARGDISADHWFALGRPYGAVGRHRALLSWTGTMFEYLMPLLYQRCHDHTLLDKSVRQAVAIQIQYGRKHGVPWGISECAFGDLDHEKTYQYYAFGVPELGLKGDDTGKIVVAPYATFLALALAPNEAMQNLRHLAVLRLLGHCGYYESLDFSRATDGDDERESESRRERRHGVIVRAYMAHHQAMSFLSLVNFLHDDYLRELFHRDPRVRTFEPLLHERIPHLPPLHHIATRERIASVAAVGESAPSVSQFETPHTPTPKTQLLSNGRYCVMLTGAGGGYSRWGDFEITRWRSDPTCDARGSFCYLHEPEANRLWCNSYHPIAGSVEQFLVNFTLDRAEFRRTDHGIECETEVIISPEDDVEIRRMTLTNRSSRARRLELTSYFELAMAPHRADLQHPAFNKLFIQTEALPEQHALLAWRRARSREETPIYVGHRLISDQVAGDSSEAPLRYATDRRLFIGRGRTLANPMGALHEPANTHGYVLDPIMSLRRQVALEPGESTQISWLMAAGSSREHVVGLLEKYDHPHAINRAMDYAWAAAQLELRLLRIQPDEARRFQQIASHLLYPSALLRSSVQRLAENRKGQAGLWAYSISGDLPIVLVFISDTRDLTPIRQLLQAHAYWRLHGLVVDLVIVNEEMQGYLQPLREALEHLIQVHLANSGSTTPGSIFLRSVDLIPTDDLALLRATASVVFVASRGTLAQQLATPALVTSASLELLARRKESRDLSAALPFMELAYFNSLGGFTPNGHEYAIYLGPGMHTPAPWVNVIANPGFGTLVSETGAGFSWQGNSQRNRLTPWSNDPVLDPSAEAIYLRDEDTGYFWTPTAAPIREGSAYRARHGAGYTVFEHNSRGIEQELTVFVPVDDRGGDPIKLQRLILRNDTSRVRRLTLTYYAELTLGESRESSQMHVVSNWDDEIEALLARNYYHPDFPAAVAFAAISSPAYSYTADRTEFIGRNRSLLHPAALDHTHLGRRTGAGLDPCAAIQVTVRLAPGERIELTCMLGQATSLEHVHALVLAYRERAAVEAALHRTQAWWDARLGTIHVHTPELATDLLLNRWLLYQSLSSRIWARSGFYQSGGAFGFRDQLQDVMALLYAQPQLARAQILLAASRQFKEGDVQHWWHPPDGVGIRSRISDDLLWLPFVVAQYLRITADNAILDESVPFLDAPLLNAAQHESFQQPRVAAEHATLFEHCQRALAHSQRFGSHGLPLMGTGDWNDGMNLVGVEGKGESVWLAWFMMEVLQGMAEMAALRDRPELARSYLHRHAALLQCIEEFAWDGGWYLRATFDNGTPLGSSANAEACIDSLPQSWAALSGSGSVQRADLALNAACEHLVREEEGLVLLFEPPFDQADPSPGYIQGYPPGVRENGGQYTHAAIWLAMALARRGDGMRAAKLLRMLNPIELAREPESVWRYGIEPYVVAADVYRLPGRIGQGGWSWYTGSAAWLYRAWIEEILGFKLRGETLQLNPVIPSWWDGYRIDFCHGEAVYEIQVENPSHGEHGVAWVELDGQRVPDGVVHLVPDPVKHRVVVHMGYET